MAECAVWVARLNLSVSRGGLDGSIAGAIAEFTTAYWLILGAAVSRFIRAAELRWHRIARQSCAGTLDKDTTVSPDLSFPHVT